MTVCLAVAVSGGCKKDAPPAVAANDAGASIVAAVNQKAPDPAAGRQCADALAKARKAAEAVPPDERVAPVLSAIGAGCVGALGELASAASSAAQAKFPARAELLAAAANPHLPPTCATGAPTGPALEVSYACPPPDAFELAEPLLEDLDAGTYVYALALREQLAKAKLLDEAADRALSNLVLAAALQGEVRSKSPSR